MTTTRKRVEMSRKDYYNDPSAPPANSVVPSVVVFVQDDEGRVLLIKRSDNGRWALPGGGQDLGESITHTAVRETEEETGLVVEIVGLSGIYTDPGHVMVYDDGEVRQQFSLCFRAELIGGNLTTSAETTEVRWVSPAMLADLEVHPTMRMRIDHALHASGSSPYIG